VKTSVGVAVLYSALLVLASISFWTIQHRELFEIWFLLLQFSNYPDEIYKKQGSAYCMGTVFSYLMPMVLAINVPAKYGALLLSGWVPVAAMLIVATTMLLASRVFFRVAIKQYRSSGS
jgi:ABC-2 type transport system permease protein